MVLNKKALAALVLARLPALAALPWGTGSACCSPSGRDITVWVSRAVSLGNAGVPTKLVIPQNTGSQIYGCSGECRAGSAAGRMLGQEGCLLNGLATCSVAPGVSGLAVDCGELCFICSLCRNAGFAAG